MRLKNEIQRAVKHLNANAPIGSKIDDVQIEAFTIQTIADLEVGNYDFAAYDSIVLKQDTKKRHVKLYKLFSTENILCQYIKQILDRRFKVKYPNRNKVVHTFFDFLKAVKQMSEFTIIKFDFKDYFNSVSSAYVFEKYINGQMTDRAEAELVFAFTSQTKYSYAGLNTSNLFSEIIAIKFDELIRQEFSQYSSGIFAEQLVKLLLIEQTTLAIVADYLSLKAVWLYLLTIMFGDVFAHPAYAFWRFHDCFHLYSFGKFCFLVFGQAFGHFVKCRVNNVLIDMEVNRHGFKVEWKRGVVADGVRERVAAHIARLILGRAKGNDGRCG